MKCIRGKIEGETFTIRVPNDVAAKAVKAGWHYVAKHCHKAAVRKAQRKGLAA